MPVAYNDPRRVHNDGPKDAKIVVLGEAPGKEEDRVGKPFVGWSGNKLFKDFLPRAGIARKDCLVGNVVPVRPPNNYLHQLPSIGIDLQEEMEECRKWVTRYPRDLVIVTGNTPMECLTSRTGISSYRGSLFTSPCGAPAPYHSYDFDIFCMYHPAAIARDWQLDGICKFDMKKLRRYVRGFSSGGYEMGLCNLYFYGKHVRRSLRTRQEFPAERSAEYFLNFIHNTRAANQPFAFDIETYHETITVFGLATSANYAVSIPFTGQFSTLEEATLVEAIRDLLDAPIPKITQNGIYDCTLLADKWGVQVRGAVYDTMIMHHLLYSELPHSLAFLSSVYTDEPFFKQMAKEADDASYQEAHWEYNALDCACTYAAWEGLCKEMSGYKQWDTYWNYSAPLSETLANMQRVGFLFDKDARESKISYIEGEIETAQEELNKIVGEEFNIKSPKQMKHYVHGILNLPKQYSGIGKNKRETLDKTSRATLRRNFPKHLRFFDLVDTIAQNRDLMSKYLGKDALGKRKEVIDPDGRFRTSFNIAGNALRDDAEGGTETGRLSSSKNAYGRGGNLQNQPKSLRDLYIPDPGYVMFQADGQSAESFIVGWLSGDELMRQILTEHRIYTKGGPDKVMMHEQTGAIVTGLEKSEIVGDFRDLAKRVGHAFNYGMAPKKCAETVNNMLPQLPFNDIAAEQAMTRLANAFWGVTTWRQDTKRKVLETRTLHNIFGYPRIFFGRLDDNLYREAYAHVPQSSVGVWMNQSLILLRHEHGFGKDRDDMQILCQVHDSVVGQCKPEVLEECEMLVRQVLERELPLECRGLPLRIPCEFSTGMNWKECG